MKEYYLMDLDTGEQFEFDKMFDVEEFTGRSKTYIRACANNGTNLYDKQKNRYDVLIMTNRKQPYRKYEEPQLCCSCKNFAFGCEWSERFEPVPGWEAVGTVLSSSEGRYVKSYHITKCPKFAEG